MSVTLTQGIVHYVTYSSNSMFPMSDTQGLSIMLPIVSNFLCSSIVLPIVSKSVSDAQGIIHCVAYSK